VVDARVTETVTDYVQGGRSWRVVASLLLWSVLPLASSSRQGQTAWLRWSAIPLLFCCCSFTAEQQQQQARGRNFPKSVSSFVSVAYYSCCERVFVSC